MQHPEDDPRQPAQGAGHGRKQWYVCARRVYAALVCSSPVDCELRYGSSLTHPLLLSRSPLPWHATDGASLGDIRAALHGATSLGGAGAGAGAAASVVEVDDGAAVPDAGADAELASGGAGTGERLSEPSKRMQKKGKGGGGNASGRLSKGKGKGGKGSRFSLY